MKQCVITLLLLLPAAAHAHGRHLPKHPPLPPARPLIFASAARHGVPTSLADRMAMIESGMRCSTGGRYGGPLQIAERSARALGFTGPRSALDSCGAGLEYGMAHLARCWRLSGGNAGAAIRCHQVGPAALYGRR